MSEFRAHSSEQTDQPYTAYVPNEQPEAFDSAEARRQLRESGVSYKEALETPNSLLPSKLAELGIQEQAEATGGLTLADALDEDGNFDSARARKALVDANVLSYKEALETPNSLLRSKFEQDSAREAEPQTQVIEALVEDAETTKEDVAALKAELNDAKSELKAAEDRLEALEARLAALEGEKSGEASEETEPVEKELAEVQPRRVRQETGGPVERLVKYKDGSFEWVADETSGDTEAVPGDTPEPSDEVVAGTTVENSNEADATDTAETDSEADATDAPEVAGGESDEKEDDEDEAPVSAAPNLTQPLVRNDETGELEPAGDTVSVPVSFELPSDTEETDEELIERAERAKKEFTEHAEAAGVRGEQETSEESLTPGLDSLPVRPADEDAIPQEAAKRRWFKRVWDKIRLAPYAAIMGNSANQQEARDVMYEPYQQSIAGAAARKESFKEAIRTELGEDATEEAIERELKRREKAHNKEIGNTGWNRVKNLGRELTHPIKREAFNDDAEYKAAKDHKRNVALGAIGLGAGVGLTGLAVGWTLYSRAKGFEHGLESATAADHVGVNDNLSAYGENSNHSTETNSNEYPGLEEVGDTEIAPDKDYSEYLSQDKISEWAMGEHMDMTSAGSAMEDMIDLGAGDSGHAAQMSDSFLTNEQMKEFGLNDLTPNEINERLNQDDELRETVMTASNEAYESGAAKVEVVDKVSGDFYNWGAAPVDADGNIISMEDARAHGIEKTQLVQSSVHLENGSLLKVTDADGNVSYFNEQCKNKLTEIPHPDIPVVEGTGSEGTGEEGTGSEGTGEEGTGSEGTGEEGTGSEGTGEEGTGSEGTGEEGTGSEGTGEEGTGEEGTGSEGTGEEGTGSEGTGEETGNEDGDTPKSENPDDYAHDPDKEPVPEVTTPPEETPPEVVTEVPSPDNTDRDTGGEANPPIVESPTNDPGSETGITAPGAEPVNPPQPQPQPQAPQPPAPEAPAEQAPPVVDVTPEQPVQEGDPGQPE